MNRAHEHVLSPSWMTLYELNKLDDEAFGRVLLDELRIWHTQALGNAGMITRDEVPMSYS